MSDVLEVRLALDELSVKLACERINDEQIERLRQAYLDFENAVKTQDARKIATADVCFHDIIFEACGNPRLSSPAFQKGNFFP